MLSRKTWETAGFITIAAALHVSAAAILIPKEDEAVMAAGPLSPSFSAGSGEISEMVEQWENPPEVSAAPESAQPEAPQQETAQPQPPQPQPEVNTARPNLPEPPMMKQSEIEEFEPPELDLPPPLALTASARPERRPARPEPEPEREVQRQAAPEPQRQQQAAPQRQAAPSGGGGGGQAITGGGGALSAGQVANLKGQWQSQVTSCILSAASRVRPSRRAAADATVNISVGLSGAVQVGLAASTGDARTDRDLVRGINRYGRCPGAPRGVTSGLNFRLPIRIQ